MNLFKITEAGCETFVFDETFDAAVKRWREKELADGDPDPQPDKVEFLADPDQILMAIDSDDVAQNLRHELAGCRSDRESMCAAHAKIERAFTKAMETITWTRDALDMKPEDDYKEAITTFSHMVAAYHNYIEAKAAAPKDNARTIAALTMRAESLARELKCCIGTINTLCDLFDVDEIRQEIQDCLAMKALTSCGECKTGCSMPRQVELLDGIAKNALLTSAKRQVPL